MISLIVIDARETSGSETLRADAKAGHRRSRGVRTLAVFWAIAENHELDAVLLAEDHLFS
jgi:hypothetical protein